jgi:hypothetical protein
MQVKELHVRIPLMQPLHTKALHHYGAFKQGEAQESNLWKEAKHLLCC